MTGGVCIMASPADTSGRTKGSAFHAALSEKGRGFALAQVGLAYRDGCSLSSLGEMHKNTIARRVLPLVVCVSAFAMLGQGTPQQNRRGAPARGPAGRGGPPAAQPAQPAGGAQKEDTFVDPRME